jgi:iron(III) transport system substrate-binding protein
MKLRETWIPILLAAVLALPFLFRQKGSHSQWEPGDPELVIISPMTESIRYEFGEAFSDWHQKKYGRPVKVDWRNIGGTTEIMRYLGSEYAAAFRAWWMAQGRDWPANGVDIILDRKFDPTRPPTDGTTDWEMRKELWQTFRRIDDPKQFTCRIDLFFGGGAYDQDNAYRQGLTVAPWPPDQPPSNLLVAADGTELIPRQMSGEIWRTEVFFGTCLSTFGICWNEDRLKDLGIPQPPQRWKDLADPAYFGQLGVADPTKSGSIAKAFEMIVHEQCHLAVLSAGFTDSQIDDFEKRIQKAGLPPGEMPEGVPAAYQAAVEQGWLNGLRLIQKIGANARYFTDAAGKVPVDVSTGNATAGISIDFYSRYEAEISKGPAKQAVMGYITPAGGSGVSADPIALLRGAQHRELAVEFIQFALSEEGQRLWNNAPGAPGGPRKYALRRLPIRRYFYPDDHVGRLCESARRVTDPAYSNHPAYEMNKSYTVDDLGDPAINPYVLAQQFIYRPRWTAGHFNFLRDYIRAMCMDSGEELRAAWKILIGRATPPAEPKIKKDGSAGGVALPEDALRVMEQMPDKPEPVTWRSALQLGRKYDRLELLKEWTIEFREHYREAAELAQQTGEH